MAGGRLAGARVQHGRRHRDAVLSDKGQGAPSREHRGVRVWLVLVILLVLAMIVVGGATRLTDSGLSITEWQPILGAIPPLTDADWQAAFDKYRQIPEYREINKGMSLAAFKTIFWWEWAHRFLGRIIGIAFALPLALFWLRGSIPSGYGWKFIGVLALGGLQGAIGWYMVMSGLVERVDVSHYRLALHLSTAFLILAALVWLYLDLARPDEAIHLRTLSGGHLLVARVLAAILAGQIVLGAFVAGLKAGLTYNTWPLMDGMLIPNGLASMSPWYLNLVENITTVQFTHRLLAYLLIAGAVWHAIAVARRADDGRLVRSAGMLVLVLFAQAALGIWTLLAAEGAIPIHLGLAHQGGAAIVLMVMITHLYRMSRAARDGVTPRRASA